MAFDVIIRGGTVVDGTGAAPGKADIGITGERITAIGDIPKSASESTMTIDATGLHISPGFIDVHSHADVALLNDGQHAQGIRQGVTTEIISPDGLSLAPLSAEKYKMYSTYLSGILDVAPDDIDMSSISAARANYHNKTACNVAMFAAHGPIRLETAGMNDVPLTGDLLKATKQLLRESLEQGAVGLSTGLTYFPHAYSDTAEMCELMEVTKEFDLPLSIHLRSHNRDRAFGNGGVPEALEIARRTGSKLHFEHHRTFPNPAGQVAELMEPIDAAKAEGLDITLEAYPYSVGSSYPVAYFPGYLNEGGTEEMLKTLSDKKKRIELISRMGEDNYSTPAGNVWSFIGLEKYKHFEGQPFEDVAEEWGLSVEEMMCRMMVETNFACGMRGAPPSNIAKWRQVEADVMELLSRPDYMIGSDSISAGGVPHPRGHGCFARFVGRLRRRHNYPIEQIIQRVTQNPAERFKLTDRGVLAEGKFADLVIFDSETINDRATFDDPIAYAEGVPHVIVNGKLVVENEAVTGLMAGHAIP